MSRAQNMLLVLAFAGLLGCQSHPVIEEKVFPVVVDYELSLEEMIKASGFVTVNEVTTGYLPLEGSGKREVHIFLLYFPNVRPLVEDVEREMRKQSLRPARIEELLAFGKSYPEEIKKGPVIALGSPRLPPASYYSLGVPLGSLYAPVLSYQDTLGPTYKWFLNFLAYNQRWFLGWRFAAVREE